MAQLKDSLITGDLRVTGKIYGLVNIDASQVVSGTLPVTRGGTGATTFTSGNVLVGAGTGAITTIAKTNANTANTLVQRDASGNFSAGTITASLTGHASSDLALTGGTLTGNLTIATSSAEYTAKDTSHNGTMYAGWGSGHMNHGVYSSGYAPTATTWTSDGK